MEGDGEITFQEFKIMIYHLLDMPMPKEEDIKNQEKDEDDEVSK